MGVTLTKPNYNHPDYEKFDVPEINEETKLIPVEWYVNYKGEHKPKYTLQQRQLMYSEQYMNENKTEWTTKDKPKILDILSKIDAPDDWKKMVLKSEKIAYSAWTALNKRGSPLNNVVYIYGDKWKELMEIIGNPEYNIKDGKNNPNYSYWIQYCDLMGYTHSFNFGDILA
jgi:hypothetical protein